MKRVQIVILVTILMGCGGTPAKQEQSIPNLKEEVMALHDEVMPKMGELRRTEKALREMATSSTDSLALVAVADDISKANEAMMEWMRGFEPDREGTDEDLNAYLTEKKSQMEMVKGDMLGSLAKGKELLGQ